MKKILTLGLAFLILILLPRIASAQVNPSKQEVKMESKEVKKEAKKIKSEEKTTKKEAKKMADSEKQVQVVEEKEKVEEVKVKKNEPRPYVSQKIEQPKTQNKTKQKVRKVEDHKPY